MSAAQWIDLIVKVTALVAALTGLMRAEQAHQRINAQQDQAGAVSSGGQQQGSRPPQ